MSNATKTIEEEADLVQANRRTDMTQLPGGLRDFSECVK